MVQMRLLFCWQQQGDAGRGYSKPPGIGNRTLFGDIEDIVMASLPVAECVAVVGTFYVDFTKCDSPEYTAYINCIYDIGLMRLVDKPTRRDAILDHIITNKPNIFDSARIVDFHYSDHDLTKFTIASRVFPSKQPQFSSYRDFRHFSLESFQSDIEASSMHKMFRMNSIDDKVSHFNQTQSQIYLTNGPQLLRVVLQITSSLDNSRNKAINEI
ncbi:hypothetical protein HHI36_000845 [Cryptolaemus montrouzieri]|uniref:Uncharacterized protein n=1 Tax=Cryptolaemus montrouzieri TaxID=559131 RepID=A0ABD2P6N4_9CUCU